jgi:uncharacterized membrane protein YjdF
MGLNRAERIVLLVNAIYIPAFALVALRNVNYEFLLYVAVVVVAALLILWRQARVRFTLTILWGLTLWGLMHMAGGNIPAGGDVLYNVQLIPRVLRYDQLVHFFGFGVATLMCHHVVRGYLRDDARGRIGFYVLVALMGCGVGAINEVIEFVAVLAMPETNVGGYDNTMWDLVFNLFGAVAGAGLAAQRDRRTVSA